MNPGRRFASPGGATKDIFKDQKVTERPLPSSSSSRSHDTNTFTRKSSSKRTGMLSEALTTTTTTTTATTTTIATALTTGNSDNTTTTPTATPDDDDSSRNYHSPCLKVSYLRSSDIHIPIQVRVLRVGGLTNLRKIGLDNVDGGLCLSVEASLVTQGESIALTNSTPIRSTKFDTVSYGNWLSFETKVSSLAPSSKVVFVLRDRMRQNGELGRATLDFFDEKGILLQGSCVRFFKRGETDGDETNTSGGFDINNAEIPPLVQLEQNVRRYRHGLAPIGRQATFFVAASSESGSNSDNISSSNNKISTVPWLTRMTRNRAQNLYDTEAKLRESPRPYPSQTVLYLHVELPSYSLPVLFHEKEQIVMSEGGVSGGGGGGAGGAISTNSARMGSILPLRPAAEEKKQRSSRRRKSMEAGRELLQPALERMVVGRGGNANEGGGGGGGGGEGRKNDRSSSGGGDNKNSRSSEPHGSRMRKENRLLFINGNNDNSNKRRGLSHYFDAKINWIADPDIDDENVGGGLASSSIWTERGKHDTITTTTTTTSTSSSTATTNLTGSPPLGSTLLAPLRIGRSPAGGERGGDRTRTGRQQQQQHLQHHHHQQQQKQDNRSYTEHGARIGGVLTGMPVIVKAYKKRMWKEFRGRRGGGGGSIGGGLHEMPKQQDRTKLTQILRVPSTDELSSDEKILLWRYRRFLRRYASALCPILCTVDWSDVEDVKEIEYLLSVWEPLSALDALELLSDKFKGAPPIVRSHAVKALMRQTDDQILRYLLPLVQSLKYDGDDGDMVCAPGSLAQFLIKRAIENFEIASNLYWFLKVESKGDATAAAATTATAGARNGGGGGDENVDEDDSSTSKEEQKKTNNDKNVYKKIWIKFNNRLSAKWKEALTLQESLLQDLANLRNEAKKVGGKTEDWITCLREQLLKEPEGSFSHLNDFQTGVRCPLQPSEKLLVGVIPSKTTMFKSAMAPLLVTFKTLPAGVLSSAAEGEEEEEEEEEGKDASVALLSPSEGSSHETKKRDKKKKKKKKKKKEEVLLSCGEKRWIFKSGDDLRQDQLVMCLIGVMDELFKMLNLDLRLTPYKVLATSTDQGLVEFVESSTTLSKIRMEKKSSSNPTNDSQQQPPQQLHPPPPVLQNISSSSFSSAPLASPATHLKTNSSSVAAAPPPPQAVSIIKEEKRSDSITKPSSGNVLVAPELAPGRGGEGEGRYQSLLCSDDRTAIAGIEKKRNNNNIKTAAIGGLPAEGIAGWRIQSSNNSNSTSTKIGNDDDDDDDDDGTPDHKSRSSKSNTVNDDGGGNDSSTRGIAVLTAAATTTTTTTAAAAAAAATTAAPSTFISRQQRGGEKANDGDDDDDDDNDNKRDDYHINKSLSGNKEEGLLAFLKKHNKEGAPLTRAKENLVRSCAGYCIITYVLGVGDRHLDNILITRTGRIFHIDFGYVFGNDPKPFAPPVRLVSEMFEAMAAARQHEDFLKYCCWAFNRLRSQARRILNLVSIMKDLLPGDTNSHLTYVHKKLDLSSSDAKAEKELINQIKASTNHFFAEFFEYFHAVAVANR